MSSITVYMRDILSRPSPKVGLLNVGEEEEKGTAVVKEAHQLLRRDARLNYVGNIEGRDMEGHVHLKGQDLEERIERLLESFDNGWRLSTFGCRYVTADHAPGFRLLFNDPRRRELAATRRTVKASQIAFPA